MKYSFSERHDFGNGVYITNYFYNESWLIDGATDYSGDYNGAVYDPFNWMYYDLYFKDDGNYIICLTYNLVKENDRRNPWSVLANIGLGDTLSISLKDNDLSYKKNSYFNSGWGGGYIPQKNSDVPYLTKNITFLTVKGGKISIDNAPSSKKINEKFAVYNYSNNDGLVQGDIFINSGISFENIIFNEYFKNFSNKRVLSVEEGSRGTLKVPVLPLVGAYDGTGNYNDWLFGMLLEIGIYKIPTRHQNSNKTEHLTEKEKIMDELHSLRFQGVSNYDLEFNGKKYKMGLMNQITYTNNNLQSYKKNNYTKIIEFRNGVSTITHCNKNTDSNHKGYYYEWDDGSTESSNFNYNMQKNYSFSTNYSDYVQNNENESNFSKALNNYFRNVNPLFKFIFVDLKINVDLYWDSVKDELKNTGIFNSTEVDFLIGVLYSRPESKPLSTFHWSIITVWDNNLLYPILT